MCTVNVRIMTMDDVQEAAVIERENFSKPWKEKDFADAVNSSNALYLTAEMGNEIVGYAGMWIALDEGEITNVSVKKNRWGCAIGKKLMETLEKEGGKAGVKAFFLEVRKSNERARNLYKRCGFQETGVRRNFYESPVEDGIVMCKR
ncbi:MAG: ribosomal protein S18-alanine N-acetyltransferase [Blautia sp.]